MVFEGEYLNGERNGRKEYDMYGNLMSEFEYLNGKRKESHRNNNN